MAGPASSGARSGVRAATWEVGHCAPEVFLNGGARATKPPIPGLDDVAWLDNDSVLHLQQLPSHLVILGGSYIGLELGQLFGRFGSAVTVIEHGPRIAGQEDPEISAEITRFL